MREFARIDDVSTQRLFVPISLGNHYYSGVRLRRLLHELLAPSAASVVFLCDQLRYLSYQIQGEFREEFLRKRVSLQLYQQRQALKNLGFGTHSNVSILSWADIETDEAYLKVLAKTKELAAADRTVSGEVQRLSGSLISKFGSLDEHSERTRALQAEYLIVETALSLYMNELQGFDYEVYRRGLGLIDFMYDVCPEKVRGITGSSNRKLLALELYWGERT